MQSFGHWRFDPATGDLDDGAATTRLEPQVAKLLDYFLANQETLVTRTELIDAVWDGRTVSDDAINRCISILRQLLSPDDRNAYIETIVRRGFISHFPPPADAAAVPPLAAADAPPRRAYWRPGLLAGIAALALYALFRQFAGTVEPPPESGRELPPVVAVLPLTASGLEGDSAFIANGMHDDLLTQLAQLQSIRVISRTSVTEYRDRELNIRDIGRELGADAILEGGVQRVGDQIRVNVQLIDARTDQHLWARQYDRELRPANIFDVQAEIARSVAAALHATLTEQDASELQVLPTDNMAAYRAFHRAMEIRNTETIAAPDYIAALEEAVALDPGFVRAWAELAGSLSYANISRQDPASIQRLEQILGQIRERAPDSADYVIAQAYFTYYVLKDYPRAYDLVRQAQDARPGDLRVLELKSWIERRLGDFDGRIETIRLIQTLDPRNPRWAFWLGAMLATSHRYDEARRELDNAPVQTFEIATLRSLLAQQDHRDPGRRLQELQSLEVEFDTAAPRPDLWEAHIAARDFAGADALIETASALTPAEDWLIPGLYDIDLARIVTYWFLAAPDRLNPLLPQARARLEGLLDSADGDQSPNPYLALATITAAEGRADETERLVRAWLREASRDLAELTMRRHYACRVLGMAGAASAAVECIRSGLAVPSLVMPLIEPGLPYYDTIRDDPAFVDLLEDLARP